MNRIYYYYCGGKHYWPVGIRSNKCLTKEQARSCIELISPWLQYGALYHPLSHVQEGHFHSPKLWTHGSSKQWQLAAKQIQYVFIWMIKTSWYSKNIYTNLQSVIVYTEAFRHKLNEDRNAPSIWADVFNMRMPQPWKCLFGISLFPHSCDKQSQVLKATRGSEWRTTQQLYKRVF